MLISSFTEAKHEMRSALKTTNMAQHWARDWPTSKSMAVPHPMFLLPRLSFGGRSIIRSRAAVLNIKRNWSYFAWHAKLMRKSVKKRMGLLSLADQPLTSRVSGFCCFHSQVSHIKTSVMPTGTMRQPKLTLYNFLQL